MVNLFIGRGVVLPSAQQSSNSMLIRDPISKPTQNLSAGEFLLQCNRCGPYL